MGNRSFLIRCFILFLTTLFLNSVMAYGSEKVKCKLEWETDTDIQEQLGMMPADLNPTLPAPSLYPEPEYTWGFKNTIFWNRDSITAIVSDMHMNLLFFEVMATFENTVLWAFPKASADSATFTNDPDGLPEGVPITYQLRYYAQDAENNYYMSYWSETESSIQDASPPILWQMHVLHLQETESGNWVIGPTIHVDLVASDYSFGKVAEVVIREKSESCENTIYYPIVPPSDSLNQAIPYAMCSQEKETAVLEVWAIDVAGQSSNIKSETLFWWPYEGEANKVVCFPNPFNPMNGETTIIKIDNTNIKVVRIFDPFGNFIQTLTKRASTDIFFEWDGRNQRGDIVASGGYLCVAEGNEHLYCKIAVIK